jgi:hypothetical protein
MNSARKEQEYWWDDVNNEGKKSWGDKDEW